MLSGLRLLQQPPEGVLVGRVRQPQRVWEVLDPIPAGCGPLPQEPGGHNESQGSGRPDGGLAGCGGVDAGAAPAGVGVRAVPRHLQERHTKSATTSTTWGSRAVRRWLRPSTQTNSVRGWRPAICSEADEREALVFGGVDHEHLGVQVEEHGVEIDGGPVDPDPRLVGLTWPPGPARGRLRGARRAAVQKLPAPKPEAISTTRSTAQTLVNGEQHRSGPGRVADHCVHRPQRGHHGRDAVHGRLGQPPAARRKTRGRGGRGRPAAALGRSGPRSEHRPERVVIGVAVHQQHRRAFADPPRGHRPLAAREHVPLDRRQRFGQARLLPPGRHHVQLDEGLDLRS